MLDFIIIVPIRDREEHKNLFLKEYYPILNDNFRNFKIVFVEQDFKNQYFNRGKILNIGIDIYKNKTKSFVTHDVDIFCPIEVLKEYLNSDSGHDVDRIYIGHDSSCGGICKFTHDSIFEVNGFPNYIWGWGIEDRALYYRYKMLSKKISEYKYGPFKNGSDFRRLNHKHNGSNTHPRNKKISDSENEIVNKSLEEQKQHIYSSGLNNLDYDIISRENIVDNIEYIKVSIDDEDEKSCEYVSIRGIAKNCDHFPQSIVSDTNDFNVNDYKCIKENESVFVISSVLDKFVQIILPTLGDIKFKLVTGACVKGVPNEISSIHKNNYIQIFKKNVIHWYTQNFDGTIECVPIPLGIDYHTLQRGNHPWGQMASATEQETILKEASNFNFEDKSTKTFSSFHFQLFERHGRDRHRAIDHLKNVKFNDVIKKPVPRKSLWNCMSSYKFIISPHGNGLDCHRTYESIILGSVPIVKSSTLDGLYEDMPVLIINDWKDLTKEVLEKYIYTGDLEKLKLNYWVSLIKNARC